MHGLHREVSALMRRVATEIMMPRFRKLTADQVSDKTPGDPVTIVDQESEALLTDQLARLLPGARVVGEEAASIDPAMLDGIGNGTVWIIDPLDGTKNFAEGKHPFAIMIGLVVDGAREASWILDPVSDRMCHAARRRGAYVDDVRVTTTPTAGPLPVAALALHFLPDDRRQDLERRSAGKLNLVAIPRCAGEQYPRLVLGQNDIALFERTWPWDHAPGALLLEEAGGRIARPDGSPYRVGVSGTGAIAAASPALWDRAADVMFG
ncbi:MAG TPA: inositol monophosphatase family protein [Sphingomonas sp.]|jgi:fructose-1,6-bisphosphatase/inositol monophosphatase family enzyme|uniref:inositol monophosphatase family protein n=1 Tax=Sphingomonas sp. TaxID=28214 RepID=UPI002ED794D7